MKKLQILPGQGWPYPEGRNWKKEEPRMKRTRLVKQALAVLLSLSMSFCPAAPPLAAFAAGEGAAFGIEAAEEIVTEAEESVTEADTITAAAETDAGEEMESATASDAEKEDKSSSTASSSDALYDEDGFLLDGTVQDDTGAAKLLPEETAALEGVKLGTSALTEAADEYKVTFDYGGKMVWRIPGGSPALWAAIIDNGFGPFEEHYESYEEAEANAVEALTWSVPNDGSALNVYVYYTGNVVELDGQAGVMTGWESDSGEVIGLDDTFSYIPSEDVIFHAQWNTDYHKMTFDYGRKPYWEADGTWYYISGGYMDAAPGEEEAEKNAEQSFVRYIPAGEIFGDYVALPGALQDDDGMSGVITSWNSDNGENYFPNDLYILQADQDMNLTAVWDTDFHTVTFDFGRKVIWQEDDAYWYIGWNGYGDLSYWSADRETAEQEACDSATFYVRSGETVGRNIVTFRKPLDMEEGQLLMAIWKSDDGEELGLGYESGYVPEQDVTFRMQWSADFYKVTVDYGRKLVWEEQDGTWSCMFTDENSSWISGGYSSQQEAEEAAEASGESYSFYCAEGRPLNHNPEFPHDTIMLDGELCKFSGWKTDTGETLPSDLSEYTPSGNVILTPVWNSDIITVTFDFGGKMFWEEDGTYKCVTMGTNWIGVETRGSREEAEEAALEKAVWNLNAGDVLECWFIGWEEPVYPGGEKSILTGWVNDQGESFTLDQFGYYQPTESVTFHPQWTTGLYTVTFDYGSVLVWEEGGQYHCIASEENSIWIGSYETREEAEQHAVGMLEFTVAPGAQLNMNVPCPSGAIKTDGEVRSVTGWKSDSGTELGLYETWSYVPSGDEVFRAQWQSDYHTVTFDYGLELMWEQDGWFYYVNPAGYIESTGDRDYAEEHANRTVDCYVHANEPLRYTPAVPSNGVMIDGTIKTLTGWKDAEGKIYNNISLPDFRPAGDAVFTAVWTDAFVVTLHSNKKNEDREYQIAVTAGDSVTPHIGEDAEEYGDEFAAEDDDNLIYGWSTDQEASLTAPEKSTFTPEADMDLYAVWGPAYRIELDADGGEILKRKQGTGEDHRSALILPGDSFPLGRYSARRDEEFIGWEDQATGEILYQTEFVPEKNMEFVARYRSEDIEVTFVENFQGSTGQKTVAAMKGWELRAKRHFEKSGYKILGYSTDPDASVPEIIAGSFFRPAGNMVLYAVWGKECILSLDFNGGYYADDRGEFEDKTMQTFSRGEGETIQRVINDWYDEIAKNGGRLVNAESAEKIVEGWYYDTALNDPVKEEDILTENTTVYAKWTDAYAITIQFVGDGVYPGDYYEKEYPFPEIEMLIKAGSSLTEPHMIVDSEQPFEVLGYKSDGVQYDTLEGVVPEHSTIYKRNINKKNLVKLTFHEPEDGNLECIESRGPAFFSWDDPDFESEERLFYRYVTKGSTLNTKALVLPDVEYRNWNDVLVGWSLTENGTEIVDFETQVFDSDTDLYPVSKTGLWVSFVPIQWSERKASYEITPGRAWSDRGSYFEVYYTEGEELTDPADSSMRINKNTRGDVFLGWYRSPDLSGEAIHIPSSGVTAERNMVLYGKWGACVSVTGVTLDQTELSLVKGDSAELTAVIAPEDATNRNLTWESSDSTVASVDETGKVTALAAGTAVIKVTTEDGNKNASCTVKVIIPVTGVTVSKTANTVTEGDSFTLTANVVPTDATNKNVIWSSSDTAVAEVDQNGVVTAKKAGLATITVTTEDGAKTAYCRLTVNAKAVPVTSVSLNRNTYSMAAGASFTLTATVLPANATNKLVTWSSSNTAVATVTTSGKVTGVKAGQAVITVTTSDGGKTAKCSVVVTQPVTGVTLNTSSNTITAGNSFTLIAAVQPSNATNKLVTWSSSDTSIATVTAAGKVTGVKAGTATITVKTVDGAKTATCRVTVQAAADPVEAFVRRLYTTCLGRNADASGLSYWTGLVKNGTKKGIRLAGDFVFSKEFTEKNYCNEHFVRQLYLALMGRDPAADPSGVKYWTSVLDKGTTREALLNSFTSTAEYKKLCANAGIELGSTISDTTYKCKQGIGTRPYGPCAVCGEKTKVVQFAEKMYTECLGRAAESTGLAYWSKGLYEKTITGKGILENFFLSKEIKGKNLSNREYVQRIYKVMLDRNPDAGGLNYWSGKLDSGASPTAVIDGFIDSKEFTQICDDYGIKRK